jgi:uncharacterized protein
METSDKLIALEDYLSTLLREDVAVAFSGGVDSSLLLHLCREASLKHGTRVRAVTAHSEMHPLVDLEYARRAAEEAGVEHSVLMVDELNEAGIQMNPVDRCYRCKYTLFEKIKREVGKSGITNVVEGTNEDDLHVYRPGLRALRELDIISPLAMFHFTKEEVRAIAREKGLKVAERPSSPCMATRFPYGTPLSYTKMRTVDEAESYIRSLGFRNVRVRVHGEIARVEIDSEELTRMVAMKDAIIGELKKKGYQYVTLDLEGFRSGSMDIHVKE